MSVPEYHWWLNLASMVGILILAFPAWSLNARKKRLQAIRDILPEEANTFKERVRGILRDKRNRDVSDWRPVDEKCLFFGYLLLLGSAIVRLFVPLA
jgi:hypothetical protein